MELEDKGFPPTLEFINVILDTSANFLRLNILNLSMPSSQSCVRNNELIEMKVCKMSNL
jgi:hypothetical protein